MAQNLSREAAQVPHIEGGQLVPGLRFKYEVRAEKGPNGDFPGRFEFELHGRWVIAAAIKELNELGYYAMFEVFEDEYHPEVLRTAEAIVLPRGRRDDLAVEQFGEHPVQEGMATKVEMITIDGEKPLSASLQPMIPARNIERGTLRILGNSSSNGSGRI